MQVYQNRKEKRKLMPAVTHVSGYGSLQTISKAQNCLSYLLIKAFKTITGVSIVLNTSLNENEPTVCIPEEAQQCFHRTKMDVIIIGNYFVRKFRYTIRVTIVTFVLDDSNMSPPVNEEVVTRGLPWFICQRRDNKLSRLNIKF